MTAPAQFVGPTPPPVYLLSDDLLSDDLLSNDLSPSVGDSRNLLHAPPHVNAITALFQGGGNAADWDRIASSEVPPHPPAGMSVPRPTPEFCKLLEVGLPDPATGIIPSKPFPAYRMLALLCHYLCALFSFGRQGAGASHPFVMAAFFSGEGISTILNELATMRTLYPAAPYELVRYCGVLVLVMYPPVPTPPAPKMEESDVGHTNIKELPHDCSPPPGVLLYSFGQTRRPDDPHRCHVLLQCASGASEANILSTPEGVTFFETFAKDMQGWMNYVFREREDEMDLPCGRVWGLPKIQIFGKSEAENKRLGSAYSTILTREYIWVQVLGVLICATWEKL